MKTSKNKVISCITLVVMIIMIILPSYSNAVDIETQFIVKAEYIYNEKDNTVTGKMISNHPMKNTKVSWDLSEDKLVYTTTLRSNGAYTTKVEDIYGNIAEVLIEVTLVDEKAPEITMEYQYNQQNNTVTAIMHSNEKLGNTKPSWTLGADQKTYKKVFSENIYYTTPVEDIYCNSINVLVNVNQIGAGPQIQMEYMYDSNNNTVTGIMHSNKKLKDTKTSWVLSEDKLTYINKNLTSNGSYTTTVEDIWGNKTSVLIDVKLIDDTAPKVTMEYQYDEKTNTVTAVMNANEILGDTKPSWKLSEDKLRYTKVFDSNIDYTTPVQDRYGNEVQVRVQINQIDKKPPEITVEYIYNDNNTITAVMNSNEILGDTKPSWTLSADKLTYRKTFDASIDYTTPVHDIHGNEIQVRITIKIYTGNISNIENINEIKYPGYKSELQNLQKQHPNWNIKVLYTGLDWETVISKEDELVGGSPKSLTQAPYLYEWCKGTETYDVTNNWYRATKSAIRYMMDPRNSFKEEWIFQFQDLSASSGTKTEIEKMTQGTFLHTDSKINSIISAAKKEGISPFHITSRILQEQGRDGAGIMNGYSYLRKKSL